MEDKYQTTNNAFIFSLISPELKAPKIFPIREEKKLIGLFQSEKSPCLGSTIYR